jgi:hypothetical protein
MSTEEFILNLQYDNGLPSSPLLLPMLHEHEDEVGIIMVKEELTGNCQQVGLHSQWSSISLKWQALGGPSEM